MDSKIFRKSKSNPLEQKKVNPAIGPWIKNLSKTQIKSFTTKKVNPAIGPWIKNLSKTQIKSFQTKKSKSCHWSMD
jgi:hypothetical protein